MNGGWKIEDGKDKEEASQRWESDGRRKSLQGKWLT